MEMFQQVLPVLLHRQWIVPQRQSIPEVLAAGLELELELEQVADVDPLASPTTGLGTTAVANNPLASPDLSLPAPSWFLARSRDSGVPVPAGRATTRGLGLVGRGESVRRPGSLPRSLPDTRLPPLPLEERSRPGPLAVRVEDPWSIQGPVEGRLDGGRPRCVPLLEVAPYVRLLGYGRGRGLLSGESHPLLPTDAGVVDSNPRIDLSGFLRYPEPERHLFEQREMVMPVAEVQGLVQHHLSPTNSSGISQAPSDVEAEVDSDSVVSDAFGGGGVTVADLNLLCLVLDDLLQISDVRSVAHIVRRQLRQLLVNASADRASSTADEGEPGTASDL